MHHALCAMHMGHCRTGGIVRNRLLSPLSTQRSTSSTHRVLPAEKTSEILTTSPPSLQNMQEIKSLFHPSNSEAQSKENVEGHKCKQQHSPPFTCLTLSLRQFFCELSTGCLPASASLSFFTENRTIFYPARQVE